MEEVRDENGRFKQGHPGQKPMGAKSDLRKKVLAFVEERWDDLPKWFDALKEKDKLLFMVELLPYCLPRLKQLERYPLSRTGEETFSVWRIHELTR